ncbi:MAG: NFACT RNA binding domain-containing protein [Gallicola sp.]|nr:NFACT RNA binding domain-containing protein [Gallicola sp.]
MSYDGIVTHFVVEELKEKLIGGKINKINQPDRNEIHMIVYNNRKNYRLLLGVSSNIPRVYITEENRKNPLTAPNFCMFLRKQIQSGIIEDIDQDGLDRTISIKIKTFNELGLLENKKLILELMGKHSNLILVKEDDTILDALKRISKDISRVRQIIPGLTYSTIDDEKWDLRKKGFQNPSEIYREEMGNEKLFQFFYRHYTGFSPILGRELSSLSNLAPSTRLQDLDQENWDRIDQEFLELYNRIVKKEISPQIILDMEDGSFKEFHGLNINYLGDRKIKFDNLSEMLEAYYKQSSVEDRISQKISSLRKIVQRKYNRDQNKLVTMENELIESKDREQYKIYGDLLSANNHKIDKGSKSIEVENFYDPELKKVLIPLDHKKSPWENTQRYYKIYSKMKNRHKLLEIQIPKIKEELKYLSQLLDSMNRITEVSEIEEIREELIAYGLIKKRKKKERFEKSKPYHYLSSNGQDIYVGKNNRQNDILTLKTANREDYFFHAKDIPGSHVILRNKELREEDFKEAAFLAAYYSSAGAEKFVEVDYTQKKNVKKSRSAKPGMVYYENFETVTVPLKEYDINSFTKKK